MVKFRETPVDKAQLETVSGQAPPWAQKQTYLSILVINHNIVGLDISVHYALAVAEVQRLDMFSNTASCLLLETYLQKLEDIIADIIIDEFRIQTSKIGVVDVLENERRRLALR